MTRSRTKRSEGKTGRAESTDVARALERQVHWTQTRDPLAPYGAKVGTSEWRIRVNDFPDDQMYTLVIDGREAGRFDDWPGTWMRPHTDPVVFQVRESDLLSKSLDQVTSDLQRELIRAALDRAKGDAAKVAKHLRIGRSAVKRALKTDIATGSRRSRTAKS